MRVHNGLRAIMLACAFSTPLAAQVPEQVTLCMPLEPPLLDPTRGPAQAIRELTYGNIFETLVAIDRDGRLQPGLAESWKVSADGLVYDFKLRSGVSFHDGTPFTSFNVAYSVERAKRPESRNAQKWIFDPILRVDTPDPLSARIVLSRPTANFLYGLAWGDAVMVAKGSAAENATVPVGTGPYKFSRWVRGERVELVVNDRWWGAKPTFAKAIFRFISDPAVQVAAIKAGDCDALSNLAAPEAIPALKRDPRLAVTTGYTEGKTILAMNNGKAPFDDVRVRRAIAMAIDRQQVIEGAMSGLGIPIGSHFSPSHPAYVDLTATNAYDPMKAKAMLAQAGFPNGFSATLKLPPPAYARRSGEIIAAMLQQIGVKITIEPLEFPQWLERVFRGKDYDLTLIAHTEPLDINIYARPDYYFQYRSPAFNAALNDAETATSDEARNAAYGRAQKRLADDAVNVFLFLLPKVTVTKGSLTGMWTNWPLPANPLAELSWK